MCHLICSNLQFVTFSVARLGIIFWRTRYSFPFFLFFCKRIKEEESLDLPIFLITGDADLRCYNRLPLQQRKTMGRKREKPNGPQLREPFMACNLLKPTTSSLTRIVIGNFRRLQSKPSGGLRWQGNQPIICFTFHFVTEYTFSHLSIG